MSKATGLDNIPARFVCDAADQIAPCIAHITNLSFHQCKLPSDLKQARVVPLYKKASKTEPGNYRPVSILCIISKIIERVVYNQINDHLKRNNLLYEFQSGFRTSYSTDTCLVYMTDYIRSKIDCGEYCGMVMIDLQKAFDTVNHGIMLEKLKAMGFNERSLAWVQSYLGNRSQVVEIKGTMSTYGEITCGVPQGSILGPLLFSLYVNDMKSAVKCQLILYADDSALMVTGRKIEVIQQALTAELQAVGQWLADNKLSLHLGKTESILFGSRVTLARHKKLSIECNGVNLEAKSAVKYLGTILDQTLSGEGMASGVLQKVYSRTKFLYRKKKFLDRDTMKMLAGSLIQCHYDYACSSWYRGLTSATKGKLQVSQNKLIRLVLGLGPRTHLRFEHFKDVNWLPIRDRVTQMGLTLMYNIASGLAPPYLQQNYARGVTGHSHDTRGSHLAYKVPRFNTEVGKRSFFYEGVNDWNALPQEIKSSQTKQCFKLACKKHLMAKFGDREQSIYFTY